MTCAARSIARRLFFAVVVSSVAVLLNCSGTGPAPTAAPLISLDQAQAAAEDNHLIVRGTLQMVSAVHMPYAFSVTSKGNGVLSVGNLMLKVYDVHADSELYRPQLLDVRPICDAAGACSGLTVSGTRVLIDEASGREVGTEAVLVKCEFDPASLRFRTVGDLAERVVLYQ